VVRISNNDIVLASRVIGCAGDGAGSDKKSSRQVTTEKFSHRAFTLGTAQGTMADIRQPLKLGKQGGCLGQELLPDLNCCLGRLLIGHNISSADQTNIIPTLHARQAGLIRGRRSNDPKGKI
jgi:hypothetical protein